MQRADAPKITVVSPDCSWDNECRLLELCTEKVCNSGTEVAYAKLVGKASNVSRMPRVQGLSCLGGQENARIFFSTAFRQDNRANDP
jgi:hypothetical protein